MRPEQEKGDVKVNAVDLVAYRSPLSVLSYSEPTLSRMTGSEFKTHAFKLFNQSPRQPLSFILEHGPKIHDILTEATKRLATRIGRPVTSTGPAKPYHVDPIGYDFNVIRTIYTVLDGPIRRYCKLIHKQPLKHEVTRLVGDLNMCKSELTDLNLGAQRSDPEMRHVDAVGHLSEQAKVIKGSIASRVQILQKMAWPAPKIKQGIKGKK